MQKRLERIIKYYKKIKEENPDKVIEHVLEQKDLEAAVLTAAISEDSNGKLHSHQYLVGRAKLELFASKLGGKTGEIRKAGSFDEIYNVVESIEMKGVGLLARYDIALRIGFYMKTLPTRVYLHRGVKTGAERLLKRKTNNRFIDREELIEPLRSADIECWEIEDILCIFKGKFR